VESSLQASIVRYLNSQQDVVARVNGPGPAHVNGDPDIYFCAYGLMGQIECKLPGETLTKAQHYRIGEWAEAFAWCTVATCKQDAVDLLAAMGEYASVHALI